MDKRSKKVTREKRPSSVGLVRYRQRLRINGPEDLAAHIASGMFGD